MKTRRWIIIGIVSLASGACRQAPEAVSFNPQKWAIETEAGFPYRAPMLADFLARYKGQNLSNDSLTALLGAPDNTDRPDKSYRYYTVSETRLGFMPLHKTILVVKMRPDSTVEWMKVHE